MEGRDRRQRDLQQHPVRREAGQVRELHRHPGLVLGPPLHLRQLHAEVRDAPAAAARGQLHGRPERLHPDRPARASRPSPTRSCAACRSTSARGCGPGTPSCSRPSARTAPIRPDTYAALFALTPKFVEKKIIPCAQPWQGTGGTFAQLYWTHIYNSTGHPMFSDDRTQVMFDGPEGLTAFQTIEAGLKSGFWDPALPEHHQRARGVRRVRQGQHGDGHAQRVGDPSDREGADRRRQARASASSRASSPARPAPPRAPTAPASTSGPSSPRRRGATSTGCSRPDIALAISLHEPELYPPTRNSVLADPEVIAAQYLIPAHTAQAKGVTNLWSTPYNYAPGLRRRRQQDDQGRVHRARRPTTRPSRASRT